MRTITFEVEVDDKIFDTMVPSIYDDAVKAAPDGRMFLCKDKLSVVKKLVKLHRDVTAEGDKESPWFENGFLPEEVRIVKITTHNDRPADAIPDGLVETDGNPEQTGQEDLVNEKLGMIIRGIENLLGVLRHLGECHNEAHKAVLLHFKQSHELENWLQEHQNRAEDRLMNHIQECCDKATLTTKTYSHDILHALPELEDRIKEYIGEPDPAQASLAGNAPLGDSSNQVLLRALDLLATVIKK